MNEQSNLENNGNINFERLKKELRESDFDGHTEFQKLTFTQKLTWLSEAVVTTYLLAKENPGAGSNDLFSR
ncbi:MAG: hypothetical protein PVH61_33895 [Candidatus Aminicenantes bacterium]|jgi:hypothetical protein